MFTAYFDAGGAAHRGGVLSIAGFVSDARKWNRFEIEWNAILARESVSAFHMTDFIAKQGEFESWKGQSERTGRFIAELIACTRKHTNKAFGGALVLKDYHAINEEYRLQEFGGHPYALCGHFATTLVKKWQTKNQISNLVLAFEKGDEHQGDLDRLCKLDGITAQFLPKSAALAFGAADLFAWRTRDLFEKALDPETLTPDKADQYKRRFADTWGRNRHEAFYGDSRSLEKLCIDREIPRR
jgi:hypothetical protein